MNEEYSASDAIKDGGLSGISARHALRKALDGWSYILLALILFLTVLSSYADMDLNIHTALNVGVDYAILLIFCYAAHFCFDNMAYKTGMEHQGYIDAVKRIDAVRARAKTYDARELDLFCEEYRAQELRSTREQILYDAMISYDQFNQYMRIGAAENAFTKKQLYALERARKTKMIRLNRYMIGKPAHSETARQSFETPEQFLKRSRAKGFILTAITVAFPVSVSISIMVDPNFSTLMIGLLKTFTVTLAGFKGYHARYKNMTQITPSYASTQEDIVDEYERWLAKRKD